MRDGLFRWSCALYALNRWILKPHFHVRFLHDHFNDLLLIPCALPVALWAQRRLSLRADDAPPSAAEVFLHLAVWAWVCEWLGPRLLPGATGDAWDVAAYAAGALAAWVWWTLRRPRGGEMLP